MKVFLVVRSRARILFLNIVWMVVCGLPLVGCGGHSTTNNCTITAIEVFPNPATADHTAAPPGNSVHFGSFAIFGPNCSPPPPAVFEAVTWSVSDPVNVSIDNTQGPNFGVATCKNATAGPITVTASGTLPSGKPASASASLTCI